MIVVVCTNIECRTIFRVIGDPHEVYSLIGEGSEWWPNKYTCPLCGQQATAEHESSIDLRGMEVRDLEVQEMFQALYGMGLPEEQVCTYDVLGKIFFNQRVQAIGGHAVSGTNRFCLEWLEFSDGTKMYFGASAHGALIYRVAKKISHTENVLKEHEP